MKYTILGVILITIITISAIGKFAPEEKRERKCNVWYGSTMSPCPTYSGFEDCIGTTGEIHDLCLLNKATSQEELDRMATDRAMNEAGTFNSLKKK